jgi:hypothetical protein
MKLSDLTLYVFKKYGLRDEQRWEVQPDISVICHPKSKNCIAFLMRQWSRSTGEIIEKCDLKCGREYARRFERYFIKDPFRMKGRDWAGVIFDDSTVKKVVFELFDKAYQSENSSLFDFGDADSEEQLFTDTVIPPSSKNVLTEEKNIPPQEIIEMKHLYDYGFFGENGKAKNFYVQGKFMENYTDNADWKADFQKYFPTYHDMNLRQLRFYFTWRTKVRGGVYHRISDSMAYVYIYELLNGIGVKSPEDGLEKLTAFLTKYAENDRYSFMQTHLRKWIFDYVVVNGFDNETVFKYAEKQWLDYDNDVVIMENPENKEDTDIISALERSAEKEVTASLPFKKRKNEALKIFADAWRKAHSVFFQKYFCSGKPRRWKPFEGAVYWYQDNINADLRELNPNRKYFCKNGVWYIVNRSYKGYENGFKTFLHAGEIILRKYFKAGSPLKEKSEDKEYVPFFEAAVADYEKSLKPEITVNILSLDKIREDSAETRDSLLTEEDLTDDTPEAAAAETQLTKVQQEECPVEKQILSVLLSGGDVSEIIKARRLMPSVAADRINEMFYEETGDSVVGFDGKKLTVVEDYREDLIALLEK